MKKNVMMRLASFLLVAVLISTSAISGTYAKYTTQDSGKDEARVAKWGVELQVFGNLYGDTYTNQIVKEVTDNGDNIRVQSVDKAADVVAPGTKNEEGFEISLKGQPEVDGIITTKIKTQNIFLDKGSYGVMVKVDSKITAANFGEMREVLAGQLYKSNDGTKFEPVTVFEGDINYYTLEDAVTFYDTYYPVVYNMTGNTPASGIYSADSLANVANEIAKKLNVTTNETTAEELAKHITVISGKKSFNANDNLTGYGLDNLLITWAWNFENTAAEGDDADWMDKADTILGNLQAKRAGDALNVVKLDTNNVDYIPVPDVNYCLDTQFSIDITVTQVD